MHHDAGWRPQAARAPRPAGARQPWPHATGEIAGPRIAVSCESTEEAFAALAPEWNRLHERAANASVFNSWMWLYQWWQVYGRGQPLRILVAVADGETVGILPLYVQTERVLGVPVRILRLIGTGGDTYPDDLGPVLAHGRQKAAARALARTTLRLPADVVLLTDLDAASSFPRQMTRLCLGRGLRESSGPDQRIDFVELPPSWREFVGRLKASRRQRLKAARRKLEAAHATRFYVWEDAARLDRAVDRLTELHRRRWEASGASASFSSPEYIDFHRRIIRSALPRGWLRLYCLEVDGELAAMTYCYRFRGRVYLMQAGFDPALAEWHPGGVLLGHAIEHAIGEGNEVFDFLRGEHRYKRELATGQRYTVFSRVVRPTLGGLAWRARRLLLPACKARLRAGMRWLLGK